MYLWTILAIIIIIINNLYSSPRKYSPRFTLYISSYSVTSHGCFKAALNTIFLSENEIFFL